MPALRLQAGESNVVVSVHCYEPFLFTHQGADWTGGLTPVKGVRYPGVPGMAPGLPVGLADWVRQWFGDYNRIQGACSPASSKAFRPLLAFARDWSVATGRPVHVGEFGVYRSFLPPGDSAMEYLRDMRLALTEYNDRTRIGAANPSSAAPIQKFAATVKLWSVRSGRPVYVGEFGAFTGADAVSRANYARTARALFEEFGLGWAWWNWNSDFRHVERPAGGVFRVEPLPLRTALVPDSVLGAEPVVIDVRATLGLEPVRGERVRLKVTGVPGVKYALEGAAGLGGWHPMGEGWSVSGAREMTVPALGAQEFFRALAP